MYDALVAFIGTPPPGLEPYVYLGCIAFTMYLISEFYSLIRMFILRWFNGRS